MTDTQHDKPVATRDKQRSKSAGDAVYFFGLIGSFVAFWQQAEGFGEHLVGALKAFVWPAFLVFEAFKSLG